jgi:membrane associated rhomboid family serine protease
MFIPLRTNRAPRRRPLVTEALIVINLLIFLAGLVAERTGAMGRDEVVALGQLSRLDFHVWAVVTYQFLHDPYGIWHIAFNLLFLWVFGCAVEGRLGRASFLGFYLIGGAVAGIAQITLDPRAAVIGASGSVAAVSGAFLALFPRSRVQVLVFFFFIGVYSIPALWFIGLYILIDVLRATSQALGGGSGGIAFAAHLAGYLYGFALAFLLLATKIVAREEFDVFYLFKQYRRRAAFRAATRDKVGGAWESASADTGPQLEKKRATPEPPPDPRAAAHGAARAEISRLIAEHDLPAATARYRALLAESATATLSEDRQLDVANQLNAEGDDENAAAAYELYLEAYPLAAKASEVRLILGLLYTRRLARPDRARELIELAKARLRDHDQKALAEQLLAEIGG